MSSEGGENINEHQLFDIPWLEYSTDFTGATHTCKIENETVSESIEGI